MEHSQFLRVGRCLTLLFLTVTFVTLDAPLFAQHPLTADGRLFNVLKSSIQRRGKISVATNVSYAFSTADYLYLPRNENTTFSQFNNDYTVDYAFSRGAMISLGTTLMTFQTTQRTDGPGYFTIPSSVRIAYKFGSLNFFDDRLQFGAIVNGYIPVLVPVNEPLIPDQLSSIGIGGGFLTSFYLDPIYPEESPGFHLNVLFRGHLSEKQSISKSPTQPLLRTDNKTFARWGFGFEYPFSELQLSLFSEVWGEYTLMSPSLDDGFVYTREGFSYVGLGARYQFSDFISGEFLGEYLIIGNGEDRTTYRPEAGAFNGHRFGIAPVSAHNFAPFRFTLGLRFDIDHRFHLSDEIYETVLNDETLSDSERRRNKQILDVIDERSEELAILYKKLRAEDTTLAGRLYFDLIISKTGEVERVRLLVSSMDDSPFARRLEVMFAEQIAFWRFPSGRDDVSLDILKFEFTKQGGFFVMR